METYTGKKFYIKSPRLQDIDIIDIAHSLALQCRFRGHCRTFYSVAEHSIRVADILPPELRLAGLLHDAAEAYVGDMIRGQKESIPSFRKVEKDILDLIYIKFTVPTKLIGNRWIKEADDILTATEGRDLMSNIDDWISELGVRPLDSAIEPYDWRVAEQLFLISFDILKGGKHEKR
jgi:hypothetical protein